MNSLELAAYLCLGLTVAIPFVDYKIRQFLDL